MRLSLAMALAVTLLASCTSSSPVDTVSDSSQSGTVIDQNIASDDEVNDEITLSGSDPLTDFEDQLDDIMLPNASLPEKEVVLDFGQELPLVVGQNITLPGTLQITLDEIVDSRCPNDPRVECNSPGEIVAKLTLSGGSLSTPQSISVGTVNNSATIVGAYIAQIIRWDEGMVVISVSNLVQG